MSKPKPRAIRAGGWGLERGGVGRSIGVVGTVGVVGVENNACPFPPRSVIQQPVARSRLVARHRAVAKQVECVALIGTARESNTPFLSAPSSVAPGRSPPQRLREGAESKTARYHGTTVAHISLTSIRTCGNRFRIFFLEFGIPPEQIIQLRAFSRLRRWFNQ